MSFTKDFFEDPFEVGDIVTGDFENNFVLTFSLASEIYQNSLSGNGSEFYLGQFATVIEVISTPESFYSTSFCKLLLPTGELGWLPSRWLKRAFDTNSENR